MAPWHQTRYVSAPGSVAAQKPATTIMNKTTAPLIIEHPLLRHYLTLMRAKDCPRGQYQQALYQAYLFLTYEALSLPEMKGATQRFRVQTMQTAAKKAPDYDQGLLFETAEIAIIAILRAGEVPASAARSLLPGAKFGHIGLLREDKKVSKIKRYFQSLPERLGEHTALVFDPVIGTGLTALHALRLMADASGGTLGPTAFVSLVCARQGVAAIKAEFPNVPILTASIDCEQPDELGYVYPGLGDVGERVSGSTAIIPREDGNE